MTRTITYQKAINEAIQQEMAADPTVVLFGEDVAGGEGEGHAFYCAAILGSPALWAPAREALREMNFSLAGQSAPRPETGLFRPNSLPAGSWRIEAG